MNRKTHIILVLGRVVACAVTLRWRVGPKAAVKPDYRRRLEREERRQRPEEARN